ncbi:Bug family tripartite tricarboxylate transporter substrate binding protein [Comamonas serinivorans]|uniref:Bug family tripartite tricarboxylate transporter substrate binding protein n=1 Tax=Comamonas serinivorans TaxID=1082851 RepID=UPI001F34C4FE|nr:tripartite tricarboxylate transporter substrate binding protein [Comamonas serinivorans]
MFKQPSVFALSVALAATGLAGLAQADTWPSKPIKVVLPYTPGGSVDTSTRMVMEPVAKALGQPIVIENKPGANTTVGTAQLVRSAADGYTFGIVPASYAANYTLFKNLPYKHSDLAPVSHLVDIPMYLFTRAQTPAKNVKELVAWAKTKPVSYASTGPGSTGHFLGAAFTLKEGIDGTHVPYNGSAPILADLTSGQIDFLFDPAMVPMPHVKAGTLKVLAVSLPKRCPCTPDVPTLEEAGVPGFVQSSWIGLMAPAGTPKAIVDRLSTEIGKALKNPELIKKLADMGMSAQGSTPAQFQALIERDTQNYAAIAKQANISLDR